MIVIHANLDAEARWVGRSLPQAIATRVSYYAALTATLAPDETTEVWIPMPIDRSRLRPDPVWAVPVLRHGTPPRAELVWANPAGKAANDRRLALRVATALGVALPGTHVIERVEQLDLAGPWVAKAPWTTAGRDRCLGAGPPTAAQRTRLARLLYVFGALVVEPWCDRILDVGVCARVVDDGSIETSLPHGLITDARGTFLGIDLAPPELDNAERAELSRAVTAAGHAIAELGHRGAFAIDAFVYRDATGARRLHPLCEINARHTFGTIARALGERGVRQLGFSTPPAHARLLVAPAQDGVIAWVT